MILSQVVHKLVELPDQKLFSHNEVEIVKKTCCHSGRSLFAAEDGADEEELIFVELWGQREL